MGFFSSYRKTKRIVNKIMKPAKTSSKKSSHSSYGRSSAPQGTNNRYTKIFNESIRLVDTTKKPDVFFSRLHVCFDALLNTERYSEMERLRSRFDIFIPAFIDRCVKDALEKASALKTEKGKKNRLLSCVTALREGFDRANTYWEGWILPTSGRKMLHYEGPLYTQHCKDYMIAETEKLLEMVK